MRSAADPEHLAGKEQECSTFPGAEVRGRGMNSRLGVDIVKVSGHLVGILQALAVDVRGRLWAGAFWN